MTDLIDAGSDEIFHLPFFRRDDLFRLEGDNFFAYKNDQSSGQHQQNSHDNKDGYLPFRIDNLLRNKATSIYFTPLLIHRLKYSIIIYKGYADCKTGEILCKKQFNEN